jgi:hypothetical protein
VRIVRSAHVALGAVIALVLSIGPALAGQPAPLAPAAPAALSRTHAWGIDAFATTGDTITTLQTKMGRTFASHAVYAQLNEGSTYPLWDARVAMSAHALIYLNINSSSGPTRSRSPYCYLNIIAGNQDSLINQWSHAILATHYANMVITFQHEQSVKSAVQPKCSSDTPARYGQAFDHIYKRMRAAGVTAPFAWVPASAAFVTGAANSYAPPAADFSIVGVDAYSGTGRGWRSASAQLTPLFKWQASKAPNKSLLIGEIAATETDQRAPQWYADAIALLKQHNNLVAVNWNGANDASAGHLFSPLLNAATLKIWLAAAKDPFFT